MTAPLTLQHLAEWHEERAREIRYRTIDSNARWGSAQFDYLDSLEFHESAGRLLRAASSAVAA